MRIGIVPNLDRGIGGVYQYAVTMISALPEVLDEGDELTVFLYAGQSLPEGLAKRGYRCVDMRLVAGVAGGLWYRASALMPLRVRNALKRALRPAPQEHGGTTGLIRDLASLEDPAWHAFFARHETDLLIFTADNDVAYRTGVPFAVTIQDIQHRLNPQFPEVSANGEWERREFRIGNCVHHAAQVLVDSDAGKEDMMRVYELDAGAVSVVPLVPASYLPEHVAPEAVSHVRERFGLPERFLFYPAAFWPHKNHLRIVEAIAMVRDAGLVAPIALTGPNSGELRQSTFDEVMATARDLGVEDLVTYLGYVEDETMPALYAAATALLMPTFFGWTNIPVLEAFRFGCPVIYSDIRGLREQAGDAAVLVDPESVDAIAAGIRAVFEDEALRERLREAGYRQLERYTLEDYEERVREALRRAKARARAKS